MCLRQIITTAAIAPLIGIACLAFQGCAAKPAQSGGAGQNLPKELNMQPPNPQDPQNTPPEVPRIPEMVGATSAPFYIGPGTTEISFEMHEPTGPALFRLGAPARTVFLKIDNVKCEVRAPNYTVYLNVPPGDRPEQHPELRAGGMGMFGVDYEGGEGLGFKLDITGLFLRLAAMKDWDPRRLRLSFVPGKWDAPSPRVKVGRASLYFS